MIEHVLFSFILFKQIASRKVQTIHNNSKNAILLQSEFKSNQKNNNKNRNKYSLAPLFTMLEAQHQISSNTGFKNWLELLFLFERKYVQQIIVETYRIITIKTYTYKSRLA